MPFIQRFDFFKYFIAISILGLEAIIGQARLLIDATELSRCRHGLLYYFDYRIYMLRLMTLFYCAYARANIRLLLSMSL
jgi:hypothetical protein